MVAEVLPLFGSPTASNTYARPVAVSTDECEDAAAALEAGLAAGMPQPPHPPDWIPPDELVAVVTKPKPRDARDPVTHFRDSHAIGAARVAGREEGDAEGSVATGDGADADADADADDTAAEDADAAPAGGDEDEEPPVNEMLTQSRWIIPAGRRAARRSVPILRRRRVRRASRVRVRRRSTRGDARTQGGVRLPENF